MYPHLNTITEQINKTANDESHLKTGGKMGLTPDYKLVRSKTLIEVKDKSNLGPRRGSVSIMEAYKTMNKPIESFAKNTTSLRNLLNTSKGRDKFCQLL